MNIIVDTNYTSIAPDAQTLYKHAGENLLKKLKEKNFLFLFKSIERTKQANEEFPKRTYSLPISKSFAKKIVFTACHKLANEPVGKQVLFTYKNKSYYTWLQEKDVNDTVEYKLQLIKQGTKKLGKGGFGIVTNAHKINSCTELAAKELKKKDNPHTQLQNLEEATKLKPLIASKDQTEIEILVTKIENEKDNKPLENTRAPLVAKISSKMQQLYSDMKAARKEILNQLLDENQHSDLSPKDKLKREKLIRYVFEKQKLPLLRSKGYVVTEIENEEKQFLFTPRINMALKKRLVLENKSHVHLSNRDKFDIAMHILVSITLLHACGWGHGDIKPGNFLLDMMNDGMVYLSDLDSCFRLPVGMESPPTSRIGVHTPCYLDIDNCEALRSATTAEEYATLFKQRDGIAAGRTILLLFDINLLHFTKEVGYKDSRRLASNINLSVKHMTKAMKSSLMSLLHGEEINLREACLQFAEASLG